MRTQSYQIANKADSRKIAEFLSKDGQLLLPFLELICNTERAVDELIDLVGKAAIGAILLLSAGQMQMGVRLFGACVYLQADAYKGDDVIFAKGRMTEVGCLVHTSLRKFFEARDSDPARAAEMLLRFADLHTVEHRAKDEGLDRDQITTLSHVRHLATAPESRRSFPAIMKIRNSLSSHLAIGQAALTMGKLSPYQVLLGAAGRLPVAASLFDAKSLLYYHFCASY